MSRCSCYDGKMRHGSSALGLVVMLLAFAEAGAAQEESKPKELPDHPAANQESAPAKRENRFETTIEILGRRSIFFPDLAASRGPLTTKQKFELFAGESVAPSRFLRSGFAAGISQAQDSLAGYGQEIGGYGKRFGSSMATAAASNFFGTFLLSSLLHRDPRYFVTMRGGLGHRVGYALGRIVITRTDAGRQAGNWPGILGPLLAESLANSYLPAKEQTAGRTFRRYGIRIGFNTAGNVLKEYWPTIFRNLRMTNIVPGAKTDPAPTAPTALTSSRPLP
jgi:hypothetical protein